MTGAEERAAPRSRPVLVHHPDRVVADAVATVLRNSGGFGVPRAGDRLDELLRCPEVPALIVLGPADEGEVGEIAEALAHRGLTAPILTCRDRVSSSSVVQDLLDGASGVATLTSPAPEFTAVARAVMAGDLVVPVDVRPDVLRSLVRAAEEQAEARARLAGMTRRQRQVLDLLAAGNRQREIAARLGVSASTARSHVDQVRAKLHTASQLEAVIAARRTLRLATAPALPVEALRTSLPQRTRAAEPDAGAAGNGARPLPTWTGGGLRSTP